MDYFFEDFHLDLENRQLLKAGKLVSLNSKYFDVLSLLVQQPGQLASKELIFDKVWNDVVVTDSALSQCIKDIRKQLGDSASNPKFIKTIPKHGYSFIADVVKREAGYESKIIKETDYNDSGRPYKFLDYYTEQDETLFFGRENEIELIVSNILGHRNYIIHGRSGVGKSSITRAGLSPVLKRKNHNVFVIRSYKDPLQEIIQSLKSLVPNRSVLDSDINLHRDIRNLYGQFQLNPVVFFLDQFEDFFLLLSKDKKQMFIETIGNIIADEQLPIKIVFVLREDLLAEMSRFKSVIPEIFHHEYRLGRLKHEQAVRAIIGPAREVGCPIAANLPERIWNDLTENGDIDPPQMQIVCDALYDNRDSDKGITEAEYEKLGGASKILAGYLERVMNRFNSDDLKTAKEILKSLITVDNTRLVLPVTDVERRVKSVTGMFENGIANIIEELGRARIIRFRRQDGDAWIEVSHDFLIPEIAKWISNEEAEIKRARSLLDRSMENFRAHQLLIDRESLSLILPEANYLGLAGEEADLISMSAIQAYQFVPDEIVKMAPNIQSYIIENLNNDDPEIRIRAIESASLLKNDAMRDQLLHAAFWDKDLAVRKASCIMLADQYGTKGQKLIAASGKQKAGIIRRAISLAMMRDHDKSMVHLMKHPIIIIVLVTLGLMWVRVIREGKNIARQTAGGTLGASISGILVGSFLGIALTIARHVHSFEGTTTILVLLSLGAIAGAFGGFGVSLGIVTMQNISFRHSHWWAIIGGMIGGFAIGALLYMLEVDITRILFGQKLTGVTGALEGLIIGGMLALGKVIAEQFISPKLWPKVTGSAIGAMIGAIILTSIEGNLFSGTIEIIAKSFSKSSINLEPLASFFGEVNFGKISRIGLGAIEGFMFGGFLTLGMEKMKK
ncbi:MAG: winged helix-turn-helix domain-containing protein [Calditrichaceae bacterium]|nr:winged helix-turn-helix domain-containing protein [Calditrichaceae bacterium]